MTKTTAPVTNMITCGCQGKHDPENDNCEYGMLTYLTDELGDRANESLFWSCGGGGYRVANRPPMKEETIAKALERINKDTPGNVAPGEKLTGNMGRKTCVTLNMMEFCVGREATKRITHHTTEQNFKGYIDPQYVNSMNDAFVGRLWQMFGQGLYTPTITTSTPIHLQLLTDKVGQMCDALVVALSGGDTREIKRIKKLMSQ